MVYENIIDLILNLIMLEKSAKFDAKTQSLKSLEVITKSKEIPINKMKSQIKVWVKIYIELIQLTPAPELRSD